AHGDELAEAMADVLKAQPVPSMRRHDLVVVLRPRQFTIAGRTAPVNARPGRHWRSRHLRLASRYLGTLSPDGGLWEFSNALICLAWMRNAHHGPVIPFAQASAHRMS